MLSYTLYFTVFNLSARLHHLEQMDFINPDKEESTMSHQETVSQGEEEVALPVGNDEHTSSSSVEGDEVRNKTGERAEASRVDHSSELEGNNDEEDQRPDPDASRLRNRSHLHSDQTHLRTYKEHLKDVLSLTLPIVMSEIFQNKKKNL